MNITYITKLLKIQHVPIAALIAIIQGPIFFNVQLQWYGQKLHVHVSALLRMFVPLR